MDKSDQFHELVIEGEHRGLARQLAISEGVVVVGSYDVPGQTKLSFEGEGGFIRKKIADLGLKVVLEDRKDGVSA